MAKTPTSHPGTQRHLGASAHSPGPLGASRATLLNLPLSLGPQGPGPAAGRPRSLEGEPLVPGAHHAVAEDSLRVAARKCFRVAESPRPEAGGIEDRRETAQGQPASLQCLPAPNTPTLAIPPGAGGLSEPCPGGGRVSPGPEGPGRAERAVALVEGRGPKLRPCPRRWPPAQAGKGPGVGCRPAWAARGRGSRWRARRAVRPALMRG